MEVGKFLVSVITFIFIIFLFPTMNNEIIDATITSEIGPVIKVFPYIFLMISIFFVLYFGLKGHR